MLTIEEKIIIGAFMLSIKEGRNKIFRSVQPEYFDKEYNAEIFEKLQKLHEENPMADGLSYFERLPRQDREVWAKKASETLANIEAIQLDGTLKAFLDRSNERELKRIVEEMAMHGVSDDELQALVERTKKMNMADVDPIQEYVDKYYEPINYISTGFKRLDEKLDGGLVAGTITAIGARPSTGKTTFALNIATSNPHRKVIFISLEMSARMIIDRIAADKADINYSQCKYHKLEEETFSKVTDELKDYFKLVDHMNTVEDIRNLIYAECPDLVVIDYMQIISTKTNFDNPRQRIDYISRVLKATAKETGSQIIILSQISRSGAEAPKMSDLKESGGLEQDSDYVILLHRPYVIDKSDRSLDPKETIVTLDKNKFGSCGEFEMDFDGAKQRFTEPTDYVGDGFSNAEINDLPFN